MDISSYINDLAAQVNTDPIHLALVIGGMLGFVVAKIVKANVSTPAIGDSSARNVHPPLGGLGMITKSSIQSEFKTGKVNISGNGTSIEIDSTLCAELKDFLSKGDKLGAIKHLREHKRLDLKGAKEVVEAFEMVSDRISF